MQLSLFVFFHRILGSSFSLEFLILFQIILASGISELFFIPVLQFTFEKIVLMILN